MIITNNIINIKFSLKLLKYLAKLKGKKIIINNIDKDKEEKFKININFNINLLSVLVNFDFFIFR